MVSQKRPERLVSRIDPGVEVAAAAAVASLSTGFALEAVDVAVALEALETTDDDFALPVRRVMNCGCTIWGGILPN